MNNFLIRYRIITARGSGPSSIPAGHYIEVYWDDVASAFVILEYVDSSLTSPTIRTSGPDLGADRIDHSEDTPARPIPYSFCAGPDLQTFAIQSTFPYCAKISTPNHFSCTLAVCDLAISDTVIIGQPSDNTTPDGSVTVSASSTHGPIKYSLDPAFNYATAGQSSGTFTGLYAGGYTITAKDSLGCVAQKTVTVSVPDFYNPLYRLEYTDINNFKTRIDILQRGYLGDPIPVKGTGDPFVLNYRGEGELNKFKTIIPSEATLNLLSETNFYFRDVLISQDERKYKLEYSKDRNRTVNGILNALSTFLNSGTGIDWTLPAMSVALLATQSTKFLRGVITNTLKNTPYTFRYNIGVSFASALTPLPALSTFTNSSTTGAAWTTGAAPSIDGSTDVHQQSKLLNGTYSFASGHTFTIFYDFDLVLPLGTPVLIQIGLNSSSSSLDDFVMVDSAGTPAGHHSGSITITTTATRSHISISVSDFANFFGSTHLYTLTINSLSLPVTTSSFEFLISLKDRLSNLLSQYTRTITASGTYTDAFEMEGTSQPAIVDVQCINSAGNDVTVTANTLTMDEVSLPVGLDLVWTGFVISSNNGESYLAAPYPVTITATDGLTDLKNYDFADKFNALFISDIVTLDAILAILNKTDLALNVQCAINKYETRMLNGPNDDPLNQCMFDPSTFYSTSVTDCSSALDSILKTPGARIVQRNAKWIIYCVEETIHEFAYREFDADGNFIQSGTIADMVNLDKPTAKNRAAFRDQNQVLGTVPAYGQFDFKYDLIKNASLVKSYSFEADDIQTLDGIVSFKNWNVNKVNAPGALFGIKQTQSFEGLYNFFYKIYGASPSTTAGLLSLLSAPYQIEYGSSDTFEFRFDYSILLNSGTVTSINPVWIKLRWKLQVGSYYFNDGVWTTDVNYQYNDIYVNSFNSVEEYKIVTKFRDVAAAVVTEGFSIEFVFTGSDTYDFISLDGDYTTFKAIATSTKKVGTRIKGHMTYLNGRGSVTKKVLYWTLIDDTCPDSSLETVRPNDYSDLTNQKVWKLEDNSIPGKSASCSTPLNDDPPPEKTVEYNYLDNIVLLHYPGGNQPPTDITVEKANTPNIKINYSDDFLLNDIDIDNINNSERTYKNFFKLLTGEPTQLWTRTYRPGTDKLLSLFANDFFSQFKTQCNRLTGSLISDTDVTITTMLNEVNDGAKKYMFMGLELHDKEATITFDTAELKDVVTDGSPDIDAGFSLGFSPGFRS